MATTRLIGTVHHVSFRVDDLDTSLRFYVDVLGCDPLPRPELSMRGAWLQAGGTQVHLIEAPAGAALGRAPQALSNLANHVAFHVDDLDAAEELLTGRGYAVWRGHEVPQLLVQDPSGNVIEMTESG